MCDTTVFTKYLGAIGGNIDALSRAATTTRERALAGLLLDAYSRVSNLHDTEATPLSETKQTPNPFGVFTDGTSHL